MKVIVGLGNPGEKYQKTRHNVGLRVVDGLIKNEKLKMKNNNVKFKMNKKFKSEIAAGEISGEEITLVKPMTYMNLSGEAVRAILRKYKDKANISDLWVVHDDVDLELGRIKIQKGGGSAGHLGVESIIRTIKNSDFVRFRVGIGPNEGAPEKFVLRPFSDRGKEIITRVVFETVEAIFLAIEEGVEKAMNEFN